MALYGKAYRLDPEVESFIDYSRIQPSSSHQREESVSEETRVKFDLNAENSAVEEIRREMQDSPPPQPLGLPDNVLLRILKWSGLKFAPSVDIIGATCRKLYLVSRDESLWLHLAQAANARSTPIPKLHFSSYRQLFLLRPRLRTDGIYISKITYFRPGASENSMTSPVHLVTYYRYLRFFGAEEGYTVWWLVSTRQPKQVIDLLRQPLRLTPIDSIACGQTANVFYGHWRRAAEPDLAFELRLSDPKKPEGIKWCMRLELVDSAKHPTIKHRILKCAQYEGMSSTTPEPTPIKIDDWSKFYFSKVRSYLT